MLRWPYWVGQSFHCLETDVSAGMGTASEETLGLYREGDSDRASGVTGLRGLLDLPEALGIDHNGRQREILGYVVEGLSNAEIARRLYLSESTIKQHLRAAYKLLEISNRTEAAKLIRDSY